jgi:hypothetical protein
VKQVVDTASFTPSEIVPESCPGCGTADAIATRLLAEAIDPQTVFGHFDTDGGLEIERDDEHAPAWFTDAHAVLLHRARCGCLCPENKQRDDFYGGRTQMPFPTFSATAADLG